MCLTRMRLTGGTLALSQEARPMFFEAVFAALEMKKPAGPKRGFATEEQIRRWLLTSPQERLDWLEEANDFLRKAMDPKTREIMEKFRRGEM